MAEARDRPGLTRRAAARRGRGRGRAVLVGTAGLVALAVAGWLAVRGLRLAGFRFRWEGESPAVTAAGRERAARPPLVVPPVPAGADAPLRDDERGAGGEDVGVPSEPDRAESDAAGAAVRGAPTLAPPPARAGPVGSGPRATIGFDRQADGRPACAPCAAGSEWSAQGLVVSFRSWSAGSTRPMVLDAREFLPEARSTLALGPAFLRERGLEVGVIRLDFPGRPRRVSFSLFGPDLVRRFRVVAWSAGSALAPARVRHAVRRRYDAGGTGTFREERVTVTSETGIDRISLDGWGPPGHLLLVDDLEIVP